MKALPLIKTKAVLKPVFYFIAVFLAVISLTSFAIFYLNFMTLYQAKAFEYIDLHAFVLSLPGCGVLTLGVLIQFIRTHFFKIQKNSVVIQLMIYVGMALILIFPFTKMNFF